jgi:hypothetical protein
VLIYGSDPEQFKETVQFEETVRCGRSRRVTACADGASYRAANLNRQTIAPLSSVTTIDQSG